MFKLNALAQNKQIVAGCYFAFIAIWIALVSNGKSIFYSFFKTFLNFLAIALFCSILLCEPGQVLSLLKYLYDHGKELLSNVIK